MFCLYLTLSRSGPWLGMDMVSQVGFALVSPRSSRSRPWLGMDVISLMLAALMSPSLRPRRFAGKQLAHKASTASFAEVRRETGKQYPSSKYNLPIIATGLLVAAGIALSQDVIVFIIALYRHSSMTEANRLVEAVHLVARVPLDLLAAYGVAAANQPLLTKACTSGIAYFLGDLMAQVFEGRRRIEWLDLSRCTRNCVAGFVLHGPALHYWIQFLEGPVASFLGGGQEWWSICTKIALDQTIFAAVLNMAYALLLGLLSANPLDEVLRRARATLALSMLSSWCFWPFVHLITYSPFMPIDFKVLWNDVMEILWVAILSVIANDEKVKNGRLCFTKSAGRFRLWASWVKNGRLCFTKSAVKRLEIPAVDIMVNTIGYATDLERIV